MRLNCKSLRFVGFQNRYAQSIDADDEFSICFICYKYFTISIYRYLYRRFRFIRLRLIFVLRFRCVKFQLIKRRFNYCYSNVFNTIDMLENLFTICSTTNGTCIPSIYICLEFVCVGVRNTSAWQLFSLMMQTSNYENVLQGRKFSLLCHFHAETHIYANVKYKQAATRLPFINSKCFIYLLCVLC